MPLIANIVNLEVYNFISKHALAGDGNISIFNSCAAAFYCQLYEMFWTPLRMGISKSCVWAKPAAFHARLLVVKA